MDGRRRALVVVAIAASFALGCGALTQRSDASIWAAVFAHATASDGSKRSVVVSSETATFTETFPTLEAVAAQIKWAFPNIDENLVATFVKANQSHGTVEQSSLHFSSSIERIVVDERTIREIFDAEPQLSAWTRFRARFPNATALLRLSRVAYSQDGQWAIAYIASACGGTCGSGVFFLLHQSNGNWRVAKDHMAWVA
jgi:hypothetical protein